MIKIYDTIETSKHIYFDNGVIYKPVIKEKSFVDFLFKRNKNIKPKYTRMSNLKAILLEESRDNNVPRLVFAFGDRIEKLYLDQEDREKLFNHFMVHDYDFDVFTFSRS